MKSEKLDGKKIIFIGNSFIYYGGCVDVRNPKPSLDDRGYFEELCRANGETVSVTDATYGGHHFYDFVDRCFCGGASTHEGGSDLLAGLELASYDYVVMAESGDRFDDDAPHGSTADNFRKIRRRFVDAGCRGKFVYCIHTYPYTSKKFYCDFAVSQAEELKKEGVITVNWGAPIYEAMSSGSIPGTDTSFDKNTFIVKQSAKDGYHPNLLTGYLSALAVRHVITGESSEGQPYEFCSTVRDFDDYYGKYYGFEGSTGNFREVFASPDAMRALQKLVDKYNPA